MIVEHRESDARILCVGKIQQAGNDWHIAAHLESARRPCLRRLIDEKDAACNDEVGEFPDDIAFIHFIDFNSTHSAGTQASRLQNRGYPLKLNLPTHVQAGRLRSRQTTLVLFQLDRGFRFGEKCFIDDLPLSIDLEQRHIIGKFY